MPPSHIVPRERRLLLTRAFSTCQQPSHSSPPMARSPISLPQIAPFSAREVQRLHSGLRGAAARMARANLTDKNCNEYTTTSSHLYSFSADCGGPPPPPYRYPVLVLNSDLQPLTLFPLTFVSWLQALKATLRQRVNVVAWYDTRVRSAGGGSYSLPAVISVLQPVPGRPLLDPHLKPFRRNVLLRDDFTCLYCGQKFSPSDLTIDHLIPQCLGGDSSWHNLASACKRCNSVKGSKLPQQLHELDMQLLKQPAKPTAEELQHKYLSQLPKGVRDVWMEYLDWKRREHSGRQAPQEDGRPTDLCC